MHRSLITYFLTITFLCTSLAHATEVVIIGTGIISSIGTDSNSYWQGLKNNTSGIKEIRHTKIPEDFPLPKIAAEVDLKDSQLESEIASCKLSVLRISKGMDRQALFGIWAAAEAAKQAGIVTAGTNSTTPNLNIDPYRVGTIIGASLGGMIQSQKASAKALNNRLFRSVSEVAHSLNLKGMVGCPAAACASGLIATMEAARSLKAGDADFVLAGAAEAQINDEGMISRQPILSISGYTSPFNLLADNSTTQTILSEGAAILALSTKEDLISRGWENKIKAKVVGYANRIGVPHGGSLTRLETDFVADTIQAALSNAKISAKDIGAILAHAPGTMGDYAELGGIRKAFGEYAIRVPIVSLTSRIGHPLSPSGTMRVIAATKILEEQFLPGNIFVDNIHPEVRDLNIVGPDGLKLHKAKYILVNSYGFGGHYASMVIGSP